MEKNYYRDYYRFEREHWWFRARREILRNYIGRRIHQGKPLSVLNIGAATGSSSEMLMAFGKVTSIEYDRDCIEMVKDKLSFPISFGDILNLDFMDGSFDLVCAFDVIEHVGDDRRALSEMTRVCRPGGHLLVTVPALMQLWSEHDIINHHFRRYDLPQLEALFATQPACRKVFSSYFNARLFPLVYAARKLFKGKTKQEEGENLRSDMEKYQAGPADGLLYRIMEGEKSRLTKGKPFRIGVSILGHYTVG